MRIYESVNEVHLSYQRNCEVEIVNEGLLRMARKAFVYDPLPGAERVLS